MTQLDSIRSRRTKFICVNDDMKNPSPELQKAFSDFYEALFPLPCQFELPEAEINPTLYLDEYHALKPQGSSAIHIFDLLRVYHPPIAIVFFVIVLVSFLTLKNLHPHPHDHKKQMQGKSVQIR